MGHIIGFVTFKDNVIEYRSKSQWDSDRNKHLCNISLDGTKVIPDDEWELQLTKVFYTPPSLQITDYVTPETEKKK